MRKKQTTRAVLHIPTDVAGLQNVSDAFCKFYLTQIETQLNRYDLTSQQRATVLSELASCWRQRENTQEASRKHALAKTKYGQGYRTATDKDLKKAG